MKKKKKLVLNTESLRSLTNPERVRGGFQVADTASGDTACYTDQSCPYTICQVGCFPGRPVMVDHAPLLAPIVYDDASWCAELDVK
jgi:hypothetical protein